MNTAAYLTETIDWMQACIDHTGSVTDGTGKFDPADPKYLRAVSGAVAAFQIVVLTEALRLLDPEGADRLSSAIRSALDDGGVIGELLWEWQENRQSGLPISAPDLRSSGYKNIWQRTLNAPQPCCKCLSTEDVTFEADPFAEDVHGDSTPVWECKSCRYESAQDI